MKKLLEHMLQSQFSSVTEHHVPKQLLSFNTDRNR